MDVKPAADADRFPAGYNGWRERIDVRVEAPAQDGEANHALCRLVADTLDIDAGHVAIKRGHTSSRKTLIVRGRSVERIEAKLEEVSQA